MEEDSSCTDEGRKGEAFAACATQPQKCNVPHPLDPQASRKPLLVRVLLQYLAKVDIEALKVAQEEIRDCERKHRDNDSKFARLSDAIRERVRNVVGEAYWNQARRIHQQLLINQQKKRRAQKHGRHDHRGECLFVPQKEKKAKRSSYDSLRDDSRSSTSSLTSSDEDAKMTKSQWKGSARSEATPVVTSFDSCTFGSTDLGNRTPSNSGTKRGDTF